MEERIEKDAFGELAVPADVYWGINTQRALKNFRISGRRMNGFFIKSLGIVKMSCLLANMDLGLIDELIGKSMLEVVHDIIRGDLNDQFPIDVYQTGSGTQTNINMNEVIANRANQILGHPMGQKKPIHPNDHANMGQSSNDVIPTAMHVAVVLRSREMLLPALTEIDKVLKEKIKEFNGIVKVGRTHIQDAVPIPLSMEFQVYQQQIASFIRYLEFILEDLMQIPIGGTALGTGLNSSEDFAKRVIHHLNQYTGVVFRLNPVKAEGIASHSRLVRFSAELRQIANLCIKMANDIRWMGSGPRAGLGELKLPQNEPGSSIMPGKVNPTQAEMLIQVAAQVIGYDLTITLGESEGSVLDLNMAKPLIITNLLDSIELLANGLNSFSENCLVGLKANILEIESQLERSLMLVTRLSPVIGYDKASQVAKSALASGKTIRETVKDMGLQIANLDEILDPKKMV